MQRYRRSGQECNANDRIVVIRQTVTADGRRQTADGRRQTADGRRQALYRFAGSRMSRKSRIRVALAVRNHRARSARERSAHFTSPPPG
ncbi:hypothetical protein F6X37_30780 [Paraburkholderia sp. 31.1]|nr:hypothetical protein [Paraburkholderia sp. 31.1]